MKTDLPDITEHTPQATEIVTTNRTYVDNPDNKLAHFEKVLQSIDRLYCLELL